MINKVCTIFLSAVFATSLQASDKTKETYITLITFSLLGDREKSVAIYLPNQGPVSDIEEALRMKLDIKDNQDVFIVNEDVLEGKALRPLKGNYNVRDFNLQTAGAQYCVVNKIANTSQDAMIITENGQRY